MTRFFMRACALAAVVALAGCGRQVISDQAPEDNQTRLSEECSIDLAAWLSKPRSEVAKLADEQDALVDKQREGFANQSEETLLLPTLVAPRTVAVFRKAKYDESAGFSLPPYAKANKPDVALAVHLARFGDHEAAAKLAGSNADALADFKTEKNYPVEW